MERLDTAAMELARTYVKPGGGPSAVARRKKLVRDIEALVHERDCAWTRELVAVLPDVYTRGILQALEPRVAANLVARVLGDAQRLSEASEDEEPFEIIGRPEP